MRTLINSFRQAQESNIQDAFEQLVLVGIFLLRRASKRRGYNYLIVYCQRPKKKRTRKSVLRSRQKRKEQDRELLDYANKLQKKLERSINRVYGNSK